MVDELHDAALAYHEYPKPGKLEITPTKKMVNQRDLALAYSPGVAAACHEIHADPSTASRYTAKGNLVAVISNGTAVLGLGSIGPLASKPVMEGKAVLFKKFAGVDVFDLEVAEKDPDRFVEIVASLEPTFGGINLEDIKAPECFYIEKKLRERMNIPVFHDDQHGTAICVAAAIRNGLRVAEKDIKDVRLVCSGAGAAAIACLDLLVGMGMRKEHISVLDRSGVIRHGREAAIDDNKRRYARETEAATLDEVIIGADIFLGLSGPGAISQEQVQQMAERPFILALANPVPEILPELVKEVCPDAIIATGRSDYPNQVNNVLCFPFIFRGALDVGASEINEAMKIACVEAIADLAMREASDVVAEAYRGTALHFGAEYLIPKPFDPRLMTEIPARVAEAAMKSGVATRPIADFHDYRRELRQFVNRSGLVMKPVIDCASESPRRVVLAEGEDGRVLRATQELVDEGICFPVLVGSRETIVERMREMGLRLEEGVHFEVLDPTNIPYFEECWQEYHRLMGRRGVSPATARSIVRTRNVALAAMSVRLGHNDAMICGVQGAYLRNLRHVKDVIGVREELSDCSAVTLLILDTGTYFLTDTHVVENPSVDQVVETTAMASELVQRFGVVPKAALLSHSNFGTRDNESAIKMRRARELLLERLPSLAVEGEMHADAALSEEIRDYAFPNSRYRGAANLLVMPTLDSANIAYNMVKMLGDAVPVGPMLLGMKKPVHVLTDSVTVRGIVNMAAVAAVDAILSNKQEESR